MPAALPQAQQHDRHEAADVQTVGGAVITNICRDASFAKPFVKRLQIGALMDKAALDRSLKKWGAGGGHSGVI
jgi:hypothetical protein